jgi:hypothetical protein
LHRRDLGKLGLQTSQHLIEPVTNRLIAHVSPAHCDVHFHSYDTRSIVGLAHGVEPTNTGEEAGFGGEEKNLMAEQFGASGCARCCNGRLAARPNGGATPGVDV